MRALMACSPLSVTEIAEMAGITQPAYSSCETDPKNTQEGRNVEVSMLALCITAVEQWR